MVHIVTDIVIHEQDKKRRAALKVDLEVELVLVAGSSHGLAVGR
jgi:hypothetical protein